MSPAALERYRAPNKESISKLARELEISTQALYRRFKLMREQEAAASQGASP